MQFLNLKKLLPVYKKPAATFIVTLSTSLLLTTMVQANQTNAGAAQQPLLLIEQLVTKIQALAPSKEQDRQFINDKVNLASSYYLEGLATKGKSILNKLPEDNELYEDHTLVPLVAVLSKKAPKDLAELAKRIKLPATDSFEVDVARYDLFPDKQTAKTLLDDLITDKPKKNAWFILQDWAYTYRYQQLLLDTASIEQLTKASPSSQYTFGSWLAESSLATTNPAKAKQGAWLASQGLQELQLMPNNRVNQNQLLRVAKNLAKFGYSKEAINITKQLLTWQRLGESLLNKDNVVLLQVVKANDAALYKQLIQLAQQQVDKPNYKQLGDIYNKALFVTMLLAIPDTALANKNMDELFQAKNYASTNGYDITPKVKVLPLLEAKQKATLLEQLYQETDKFADSMLSDYKDLVVEMVKQGLMVEAKTLSGQINNAYLELAKRSDVSNSQLVNMQQNLVAIFFAVEEDDKAFALLKDNPELLSSVPITNNSVESGLANAHRAMQLAKLYPAMTKQGLWSIDLRKICPQVNDDCQQLMAISLQEQSKQMVKAKTIKDLQYILQDVMRLEYLNYLWKNKVNYNE